MDKYSRKSQRITANQFYILLLVIAVGFIVAFPNLIYFLLSDVGKPKVTYAEFPFELIYEINGEEITVKDTIVCEFEGYGANSFSGAHRKWNGYIKSTNSPYIVLLDLNSIRDDFLVRYLEELIFDWGTPEYYVDDAQGKNKQYRSQATDVIWCRCKTFSGNESFYKFYALEAYDRFGIKIISWKCSPPIENEFE